MLHTCFYCREWFFFLLFPLNLLIFKKHLGFPGGASGKEPPCKARSIMRCGFNPELGGSPGGGHGSPLQYSCLENPMDRGVRQTTVHGISKSRSRLKWLSTHTVDWILHCILKYIVHCRLKYSWGQGSHLILNGTNQKPSSLYTEGTHQMLPDWITGLISMMILRF